MNGLNIQLGSSISWFNGKVNISGKVVNPTPTICPKDLLIKTYFLAREFTKRVKGFFHIIAIFHVCFGK